MASEQIFWHMGLTFDTFSLLQKPGFLQQAENILFEREGIQDLRPFFGNVNSTPVNSIHSIKAWRGNVFIGDDIHLRGNAGIGDFTDLYSFASNAIWQFKAYKDFVAASNGASFIIVDENLNVYPAQVKEPITSPTATAGGGGLPSGVYKLYVSYFITWPNGQTYETGLSPIGNDVTVSTAIIDWANIPICPYSAYYGTAPTIYRNLYRGPGTGGALTEIYYLGTITDNSTTTYSDNISDSTLETSYVCVVNNYIVPIVPKYFEWNYGRLFAIDSTYTNRLYWSEVAQGNTAVANEELMPLAMQDTNWDDIRVAGFDSVEPMGLISFGSYLYIPLKQTWVRKQGNDPTTWAYRKTYADHGIGAPWTIDVTPAGIIGVTNPDYSEPGIALFNGIQTEIIASPRLDYLFKTDINIGNLEQCRGGVVGKNYILLYPSAGSPTIDKFLVLDTRKMSDIKVGYWTGLNSQCFDTDTQTSSFYLGGYDGFVRAKSATGTCDVTVQTHDCMGGDVKAARVIKTWREMKYAIDTGGQPVTLQYYIDDVLMSWPDGTTSTQISGSNELTQVLRSLPANWKGYKISILITGTDMAKFELYSPWSIDFEATQ